MYFQILLGHWQGVILQIPYGCFGVFSPFLPNKHRMAGFFLRFEDGPSKLIPYQYWRKEETNLTEGSNIFFVGRYHFFCDTIFFGGIQHFFRGWVHFFGSKFFLERSKTDFRGGGYTFFLWSKFVFVLRGSKKVFGVLSTSPISQIFSSA